MFANRIAVVTGAGSGIGRAVAYKLAKENASVVIADLDLDGAKRTKELIEEVGKSDNKHITVEVDVSVKDSVQTLFKVIEDNYEKRSASLLVNCAGITRDKMFMDMTEEDLDKVIAVNLKGTFLATQIFCQIVKRDQLSEATIVNISSTSAKLGNIGQANYNASKAGVEAMTRTVAREMARYNVRANCVQPGFIDTPIVKTIPEKLLTQILSNIPLRRQGKPEELAEAISFLLSPKASYITGTVLQVSGGLAM